MCDPRQPATSPTKEADPASLEPDSQPAKPKVCSCDKPCCRNQLIKKTAAKTGRDS